MQNNYINVAYKLYVKDVEDDTVESLVEESSAEHPFQFISNLGEVLPAFEAQVANLPKGSDFDFVIPCADGYGEYHDELMFDVEKKIFEIDGRFDKERIYEGNVIPLMGPDGERFYGLVIEIKEDAVTIDLNHPRAGQDLHYVGTVVENREATTDEVTGRINMMSSGGCGCGCGSCGGDCGCGCGDHDSDCGCGHCH